MIIIWIYPTIVSIISQRSLQINVFVKLYWPTYVLSPQKLQFTPVYSSLFQFTQKITKITVRINKWNASSLDARSIEILSKYGVLNRIWKTIEQLRISRYYSTTILGSIRDSLSPCYLLCDRSVCLLEEFLWIPLSSIRN